jgi:hypothetical protein
VSTPGLIALFGNLLATVAILPHLVQAVRDRRPSGSPYGWALGAATAALWLAYGWTTHTPQIGAPGYVTFPVSVVLGVWSLRTRLAGPDNATVGEPDVVDVTLDDVRMDHHLSVDDASRADETRSGALVTAA